MMKFFVKGQRIEITEREVIASGQIAFVTLKFTFDCSWKNLHKVVQFSQCDEVYSRVLGVDGLSCLLPSELHSGMVKMSVFGYDSNSDMTVRATTVPVTLHVRPSGFDGESCNVPPTPDLYAQLLAEIKKIVSEGGNGINGKDGENGLSKTVRTAILPKYRALPPRNMWRNGSPKSSSFLKISRLQAQSRCSTTVRMFPKNTLIQFTQFFRTAYRI